MATPWDAIIGGAGAAANYFTGKSANKASKEMMRAQKGILKQQAQTYKAAQPTYMAALQQYAQAAGLDPNHHTMQPMPGQAGYQMGNQWGQPEDQMRFAAAQDQINHMAQQRQNQLQHTLAARGVASSSVGAALAHNQRAALQDLAGFRRQLAIDAPHEAERRRAALLGALGPAFGQGAQASAGYGQQGAQYGAQAQNAYANIGGILQNYQYGRALGQYGQQPPGQEQNPYAAPGGMPYGGGGQDWFIDENGEVQYR